MMSRIEPPWFLVISKGTSNYWPAAYWPYTPRRYLLSRVYIFTGLQQAMRVMAYETVKLAEAGRLAVIISHLSVNFLSLNPPLAFM
jgi:hypothetical protein